MFFHRQGYGQLLGIEYNRLKGKGVVNNQFIIDKHLKGRKSTKFNEI